MGHRARFALSATIVLTTIVLAGPAYAAAGDLDPSFGTGGEVLTKIGQAASAADVAVQADQKIVAVGTANSKFVVARYKSSGTLDNGFGNGGIVKIMFGTPVAIGRAIAIGSDGKIVVAGTAQEPANVNRYWAVARLNPDGTLDTTFSQDGKVLITNLGGASTHATDVGVQSDLKVVVVGDARAAHGEVFETARFTKAGALDTTFNGDGKAFNWWTDDHQDYPSGLVIQPNGKLVVSGTHATSTGVEDFALVRLGPLGNKDGSFGIGGKVLTSFGSGITAFAYGSARQASNGSIVVSGTANVNGDDAFALARYTTSGALDQTFSGDGKVTTQISGGADRAEAVAIHGGGKVVAAGHGNNNGEWALTRYTSGGTLDTTFSGDGIVFPSFGSGFSGSAEGVTIQADGNIVAAGFVFDPNPGVEKIAVARLLAT
jgi:uncharacterized delta-60 repeat protein